MYPPLVNQRKIVAAYNNKKYVESYQKKNGEMILFSPLSSNIMICFIFQILYPGWFFLSKSLSQVVLVSNVGHVFISNAMSSKNVTYYSLHL